jgi:hypothetical protein
MYEGSKENMQEPQEGQSELLGSNNHPAPKDSMVECGNQEEGRKTCPTSKKKEAGLQKLNMTGLTLQEMKEAWKQVVREFQTANKKHDELHITHINKMSKKI